MRNPSTKSKSKVELFGGPFDGEIVAIATGECIYRAKTANGTTAVYRWIKDRFLFSGYET